MSYTHLETPTGTPSVVTNFVYNQLGMQLADIHCMLRLPIIDQGLHSGCNFAAANSLFSIVSGMSAWLTESLSTDGQSGPKFHELLKNYYPWDVQPPQGRDIETTITHLYKYFRNPLAHTLGVRSEGNFVVAIVKSTMTEENIIALELQDSPPYPAVIYTPVTVNGEQIEQIELYVHAFYWGIRKMCTRLMADATQITKTAQAMQDLGLR